MNKAFEKIIDELKQESIIVDDDAGHRARQKGVSEGIILYR